MEGLSFSDTPGRPPVNYTDYEYDSYLASEFHKDCTQILEKFKSGESFTFKDFAKLWVEASFIRIFEEEDNCDTLRSFLENAFFVIKKFLDSADLPIQIGAVFLLYGVYHTQPIANSVKIRLTLPEAQKIDEIIEKSQSKQVCYVYYQLRTSGAFIYVAVPLPLRLTKHFGREVDLKLDKFKEYTESLYLHNIENLLQDSDFEQLKETDGEYRKLMDKCAQKYPDLVTNENLDICGEIQQKHSEIFKDSIEIKSEIDE